MSITILPDPVCQYAKANAIISVVGRPPERPIVPTSASDWESKKQIIRELYMDQNMILNEVIDILISKHKFKATARMYKGQFAKWRWTKYNKSGKPGSIKPTRSRVAKKNTTTRNWKPSAQAGEMWELIPVQAQHLASLSQHAHLQYLTDEERRVETTLSAYAALISHWSERETPWRTVSDQPPNFCELFQPRRYSILQHVRSAHDCFLAGQPQQGGDMLRRAFLGIESAVENGVDMEALWDCCLAVPHLVLTTGWTDMLAIFTRYLHQYTTIKLQSHHPLTHIAGSLHRLSTTPHQPTDPATPLPSTTSLTNPNNPHPNHSLLSTFVHRAWHLWIDTSTHIRGRHDDVTIHLKRGYVTLVDARHAMAGDILRDFGRRVRASLARRGAAATTARILELEDLLVRMYLPLFVPGMLRGVVGRVEGKGKALGRGGVKVRAEGLDEEGGYVDRYLVFSARNFMAGIAEGVGEWEKARVYRRESLEWGVEGRDLFWLQTSWLVESRLREQGNHEEADRIREARAGVDGIAGPEQLVGY
ncbi:hypothetical protein B0I37DRAFT_423789 [Chaetomium sp. MPI-CAGE-AT-0009]|nr:hypothetical protein B0I37DRAFT_423789 [Chaetomium sp. MPI-CAGE-AT-0009]